MNNMLGYNIYNALRTKKITATELSRRLNCNRQWLSVKLHEPDRLTINDVIKIGAAIGINWRDLLEGVE